MQDVEMKPIVEIAVFETPDGSLRFGGENAREMSALEHAEIMTFVLAGIRSILGDIDEADGRRRDFSWVLCVRSAMQTEMDEIVNTQKRATIVRRDVDGG